MLDANKPTSVSPGSSAQSTYIQIDTAKCGQGVSLMMILLKHIVLLKVGVPFKRWPWNP